MKKHLSKIVRKFDTENKSDYDWVLNQSERIKELAFFDWNRFKQSLTQDDFFLYPNTIQFRKKSSCVKLCLNLFQSKNSNSFILSL